MAGSDESLTGAARLTREDGEAIDALVDARFDPDAVPGSHLERARRSAALLRLLEGARFGDRAGRIDRVVRAALEDAMVSARHGGGEHLSGDDAESLDAWVLAGFRAGKVPGALRGRAERHAGLASLVTAVRLDAGDREARISRTVAQAGLGRDVMSFAAARERQARRPIRLADIVSVAAVLLIAASVVWPIGAAVRDQARRAVCASHLASTAMAFGSYAGNYDDSLPMAAASFGGSWWDVGRGPAHSNSANLYLLPRERYARLADLACPGNPNAPTVRAGDHERDWRSLEEVSYSYQLNGARARPLWRASTRFVVLTDRSPVVIRAVRGEVIQPEANSPNHGRRGQHVLWSDGSAEWRQSPVLDNGDNVWLPRSLEALIRHVRERVAASRGQAPVLKGTELPEGVDDAFVGP